MSIEKIKSIFLRHKKDLAFILGNGINRYHNKSNVSWEDMLLDLWDEYSFDTRSLIPDGISLTEFYDILELQNYSDDNFGGTLQKAVVAKMTDWNPSNAQNIILNKIKGMEAPLLTTNFDDLISKSLELKFNKLKDTSFTDFYPWACYYGNKELNDPAEGFGVWHINGMIKYHRSIKLGLSQYIGNVERVNNLSGVDNKSWLNIIFNKSLFICGLGLDESEVFLRWLLIMRAKYFRATNNKKHKGWFIMKKENKNSKDEGKRFFLNSVGIETIELSNYKLMYEDIWK